MDFKCPICERAIPSASSMPEGKRRINAVYFPFCSERCRLVDLGAWMDGNYRIVSGSQPTQSELSDE
ncbi:MAG: DNA gyrase inhibitor YacG [Planctomycetota bacterium]